MSTITDQRLAAAFKATMRGLGAAVLAVLPVFSLMAADASDVERTFRCRYRATAYVTFLSMTIFSRSGVGFGFAQADEHSSGTSSLRFLSGSTPERASGLNRFGFIQENVAQAPSPVADYFGLMTASAEESLEDAKTALHSKKTGDVSFVAARAFVNQGQMSYSVRHLLLPASYRGSNADQLLNEVQAEFAKPQASQLEKTEVFQGQPASTFLNSLRQAILTEPQTFRSRIVFNGKTFQFLAEKHLDRHTGSELRKAGLTASPEAVVQLTGTLRNEKSNEITNFHLWFEKGTANFLPLRFEFKAKPYLRLVFDQEPLHGSQQLSLNRSEELAQ